MIPPAVIIHDDLRQSIIDCRAGLQKQLDAHKAAGPDAHVAGFVLLHDAKAVLVAIADHWRKTLPGLISRQVAPFALTSEALTLAYNYCGAVKVLDDLRNFRTDKLVTQEKIDTLFRIFERALAGKIYLTDNGPVEAKETE